MRDQQAMTRPWLRQAFIALMCVTGLAGCGEDEDQPIAAGGGGQAGSGGAAGSSTGGAAGQGGVGGSGGSVWEPRLRVAADDRHLEYDDSTPFFWLGDTAWLAFHRLTVDEADDYFADRQSKGFTVVQAAVHGVGVVDGVHEPSHSIATGELPLINEDPTQPNEAFYAHVDAIVQSAADHHLFVGLLPTWGEYVCPAWHNGPKIFDEVNADSYGRFMGARYRDQVNIIWVIGGDRAADECSSEDLAIWRALAEGIKAEDPNHLMTYHPQGGTSSVTWFHDDAWLDFNMYESYVHADRIVELTSEAYAATPPKPVVNGEPAYYGYDQLTDREYRSQPYWTLLAGGAGHTFGQRYVWRFSKGDSNFNSPQDPNIHYTDYLDTAATAWVLLWKDLFQSLDWWALAPEPGVIVSGASSGTTEKVAARTSDGQTVVVYFPSASQAEIDMTQLSANQVQARWFNPTDGSEQTAGTLPATGSQTFEPPAGWEDGVLLLEAAD
jgi:hypothetical protein